MASAGVNVLRWSALGLGVIYGVYHQASISARDRLNARRAEWDHKEDLISQAKAEFARQNAPPESKSSAKSAPVDPKEDLEAFYWLREDK